MLTSLTCSHLCNGYTDREARKRPQKVPWVGFPVVNSETRIPVKAKKGFTIISYNTLTGKHSGAAGRRWGVRPGNGRKPSRGVPPHSPVWHDACSGDLEVVEVAPPSCPIWRAQSWSVYAPALISEPLEEGIPLWRTKLPGTSGSLECRPAALCKAGAGCPDWERPGVQGVTCRQREALCIL